MGGTDLNDGGRKLGMMGLWVMNEGTVGINETMEAMEMSEGRG